MFILWAIVCFAVGFCESFTGPVIHERRDGLPQGWSRHTKAAASSILPMRIGLVQSNLERGHDLLMDVSSYGSPNYGNHYTAEQVIDIFAPSQDSVDSVMNWLAINNMSGVSLSANKQWIQFDTSVEDAERLLQTEYHIYKHAHTGRKNIACDEYHVPLHLTEHIDFIRPGILLLAEPKNTHPSATAQPKKRDHGSARRRHGHRPPPVNFTMPMSIFNSLDEIKRCQTAMTPDCIAILYNITRPTTAVPGNELGIFEDLGQVYSQTDLDDFFMAYAPYIPQGTHPILDAIDGAIATVNISDAPADDFVEPAIDFQVSYPIIYPQNSVLFQTDDPVYENNYTFIGFFNTFLDAIDGSYCSNGGETSLDPPYPDPNPGGYKGTLQCGIYKPTNVISISYGGSEADFPTSYLTRQCAEFMKLGLQGVSFVVSSGDSGVAGSPGDPSPNGCLGSGQVFAPQYPASCPYVTTVGATFLPSTGNVYKDEEIAVTRFPSGGGFSNVWPTQSYQEAAVSNFLSRYPPSYPSYETINDPGANNSHGGLYNRGGRAYPDIAALGDKLVTFTAGVQKLWGGTSVSAPLFASILTRINEERLQVGKSTVGFVNPVLYAHPEAFHDIIVGNNSGVAQADFTLRLAGIRLLAWVHPTILHSWKCS